MTIILLERFDDPSLSKWTVDVGGNNSITQVSEGKTFDTIIAYTETRVDIVCRDTANRCWMYHRFSSSKRKVSVTVVLKTPSIPTTAGNEFTLFGLAIERESRPSGMLTVRLADTGHLKVYWVDSAGNVQSTMSTNTYDNQVVRITIYVDLDTGVGRVYINQAEEIEITNVAVLPEASGYDYVFIGETAPPEPFSFSVYSIAVGDAIPSIVYTIQGLNAPYFAYVAWSKELGVYAVPYADLNGNCKVDIRNVSDHSLITTIDLGETINISDLDHEFVMAKFIKEGGRVYLYVVVGRHGLSGTLIKIDPSNWSILWKRSLSVGTYPRIVVYRNRIAVIQREDLAEQGRPLYMHVYDPDGNLVDSIKVVDAGSTIYIYPDLGVDESPDGRYIAIFWTYYDETDMLRHNVYGLIYDARQNKWFAWNGVEKTLPVAWNDPDCLVSQNHQTACVMWRNGKLYVALGGMYDPQTVVVYELDPSTWTVRTIYDGTDDDLKSSALLAFIYDPSGGLVFAVNFDYDGQTGDRRPYLLWNYNTIPGFMATFLDLETKLVVIQNGARRIEAYELPYASSDSPSAETSLFKIPTKLTLEVVPL